MRPGRPRPPGSVPHPWHRRSRRMRSCSSRRRMTALLRERRRQRGAHRRGELRRSARVSSQQAPASESRTMPRLCHRLIFRGAHPCAAGTGWLPCGQRIGSRNKEGPHAAGGATRRDTEADLHDLPLNRLTNWSSWNVSASMASRPRRRSSERTSFEPAQVCEAVPDRDTARMFHGHDQADRRAALREGGRRQQLNDHIMCARFL